MAHTTLSYHKSYHNLLDMCIMHQKALVPNQ